MSLNLESNGHSGIASFIQFWIMVRGLFIAGVILAVLFSGDPSLLEAVVGWIERH